MIYLVVGNNQTERHAQISSIVQGDSELFVLDETQGTLLDLEQYLYPSLFMSVAPVVHLKYMLDSGALVAQFLQKLLASPTVFVFEEIEIPSALITTFKKAGATVYVQEKIKSTKREADIFAVTNALTAVDKKKRWMAYRDALALHPVEAIMGILYWKVRDMAIKMPKEKEKHLALYRQLLKAHARAWETGTPLELVIEKVLLTQ
jgi:hypothetical protein